MKEKKKKSPEKLRQSKITWFCSQSRENSATGANPKKRKIEEAREPHSSPKKKATSRSGSESPDLFLISPEGSSKETGNEKGEAAAAAEGNGGGKENHFENFVLDDFENDPFSSPKKDKSPKENVLRENRSLLFGEGNGREEKSEIGFENPVRCRVVRSTFVTKNAFEQVLTVREEKSGRKGACKLREVWTCFAFSADDLVSVQAVYLEGSWVVDNKFGYVILFPDVLVSSTTLVGSMFCMRQGLLSSFFKGMDSQAQGKMLLGRLVHELFQESLKGRASSEEDFARIVAAALESEANLRDFYFADLKASDIRSELENFVPRVRHFLDVYLKRKIVPSGRNFEGVIEEVLDVEELVRSPVLGVQGRIDVTVKVKSKNGTGVAPLELKTGRASFSNEHRSQLSLYVLLMNELGRRVESGLLLYLREDAMEEIAPKRDEIRNLFLLRNHFVGYYKTLKEYKLPDPIRNAKCCSKCPYLRICTTYLKGGECEKLSESHPLGGLETPDIKPSHVDYFVKWHKMLWLEYEGGLEDKEDSLVSDLTLQPDVEKVGDGFRCTFRKEAGSAERTLRPGSLVHVTNAGGTLACSAQVVEVAESSIRLLTEKKPEDFSDGYRISPFKSKFLSLYLTNLGHLLDGRFESLREIIVDKKLPSFDQNLDKKDFQEKCLKNLMNLNGDQRKAVLKALLCRDYLLIKGPPGTGKTQTIVSLVKILLALEKNVLVVGHTHSSVDNILLRLGDSEYLRLGSSKSIREEIRPNSYAELVKKCKNVEDVRKLFGRKLIASTCLGIDTDFLRKRKVDVCIVDESSQVLQPEVLRPLFCCEKFVLVGDEDQLPPIVQNPEARKLGMAESIFEWLRNEAATVSLSLQYRMNSVINSLANAVAYEGSIECADRETAEATLEIKNTGAYEQSDEWVRDVLSPLLEKSVVFVDTSEGFRSAEEEPSREGKRSSRLEANLLVGLVKALKEFGVPEEKVGVITPFWDQIQLVRKKLEEEGLSDVELNTVEQYQGRDKEVILFSCTKENRVGGEASDFELLSDKRRLTVVVTRAKRKLILLGDTRTVAKYEPFQKLLKNLRESQIFRLSEGHKNFFWKNFLH